MIALIFHKDPADPGVIASERGCCLTIGSFDGVHKGHQKLISTVVREGRKRNCDTVVITFDPLPKQFFSRGPAPFTRLTDSRARAERIGALGVDHVLEYTFDRRFSFMSAEDFVRNIVAPLHPQKLYAGQDFRFGYKGLGDGAFLKQQGARFGFDVELLDFEQDGGGRISSTRVRDAVNQGDLRLAIELMSSTVRIDLEKEPSQWENYSST